MRHVVVDGSNVATEGRSLPSLAQLMEAVSEFAKEHPEASITVVVDASFGHRIDPSELADYEAARDRSQIVSPPAGAIGRGDAFLLRIAEKVGAVVLSNDSFQEFHGEHEWLFEEGRLIGGKPVPGVGWIFTPRTPVRGPKSRESVKVAKRSRVRVGSKEASQPMPVPKSPPPGLIAKSRPADAQLAAPEPASGNGNLSSAIAQATEEAVSPATSSRRKRRRRGQGAPIEPVNEPLSFITFIASHRLGDVVEGEVEGFSSHGAFVNIEGARCYVPLSAMGSPPPRSAREVLTKGSVRGFVLQALDPQRRGIELALPGFESLSGAPQEETIEAEIEAAEPPAPKPTRRRTKKAAVEAEAATPEPPATPEAAEPPAPKPTRRRTRKAAPEAEVATPEPPATPKAAEPPAPKPARRRTKKVEAEAEAAEVVQVVPPAEPPAPKPTRRRTKKAAVEAEAEVAIPEPPATPEAAEPPAPKPTRRRTRKAAAEAEVATPEPPATPEAAEPPAPKPTRRRTKKVESGTEAATPEPPATPEAAEPPAPKPTRRRTRKAAAEAEVATPEPPATPEAAEPPAPKPTRRRTKKVESGTEAAEAATPEPPATPKAAEPPVPKPTRRRTKKVEAEAEAAEVQQAQAPRPTLRRQRSRSSS